MARISYDGFREAERQLGGMSRKSIRRIVLAGGQAAAERMRSRTDEFGHKRSGAMLGAVGMTDYKENLDGGSVEVYPLGEDSKGARNATKAYVINYGRYGKRGPKSGDKFITGDIRHAREAAYAAMKAESERIVAEANGGK